MPEQLTGVNDPAQLVSASSLASYVRARIPELADQPDHMLVKYLFDRQPEFKQNTLVQSRQPGSTAAFEQALPTNQRSFASGSLTDAERSQNFPSFNMSTMTQPLVISAAGSNLRDYFLKGIESLGIDPAHPLKSAGEAAINAAKFASSPLAQLDAARRLPGIVASGPSRLLNAKTPQDVAEGAAETTTQTLPLIEGASALSKLGARTAARAAANAIPDTAADALMGYGAKIKGGTAIPSNPITDKIPGMRLARAATSKLVREPVGGFVSNIGQGLMDEPVRRTAPIEGATEATPSAKSSTRLPAPPQKDPFAPGYQAPAVESMPKSTPQVTTRTIERSSGNISGAVADVPKVKIPTFFKDFKAGLSPEVSKYYNANLNNMSRDAQTIFAEQGGKSALAEVDKIVGGPATRQKMLATPTGQNMISNFIDAMRKGDAGQLYRHGALLGQEAKRTAMRTIIPPPPG